MGNEKSQPAGLVIEENAIEVADRWSLHSATYAGVGGNPKISVFVGPAPSYQTAQNLLEKFVKNLMIHRHPCILKYVTSWQKGGKIYLATEGVKPLVQVLPTQTALQVCIGLQNVLKALIFLHDKAQSSHNNVCRASIYVTPDGSWKLGGLEYLCRFTELSSGYLSTTRVGRYDAGISPSEPDQMPQPPSSVDCFAFGVLAEEVLSAYSLDDVPGMQEFKEMCKNRLQNPLPSSRPLLNSLLDIIFFTHEFINVHNFLTELTLKTDIEKQDFFRGLSHKLSLFDEEVVASQLSTLLLSRMVLLDTTAQQHFLPLLLVPRTNTDDDVGSGRLFSEKTFKTHLVPKLLMMFCIRDAHVRLILLTHFSSFCSMFSATHLKMFILPELLVGIKDTNDTLVSSTLRALADIVPILGSSVVIGGKSRGKLFADGRPKAASVRTSSKNHSGRNSKSNKHTENDPGGSELCLPERASPDGGEDFNSPIYTASEEEAENWTDWENTAEDTIYDERESRDKNIEIIKEELGEDSENVIIDVNKTERDLMINKIPSENNSEQPNKVFDNTHKSSLPDVTTLDMKLSKIDSRSKPYNEPLRSGISKTSKPSTSDSSNVFKEIDYFQDMEPVITSSNKHNISNIVSQSVVNKSVSKFEISNQDLVMNEVEGWGDDVEDVDISWTVDSDLSVNFESDSVKNDTER